jgi:hypothetical protein
MLKRIVVIGGGAALLSLGAATLAAPEPQDRPGIVSQPQVTIVNRGRGQAIPVSIQEWVSTDRPVPVQVMTPVALAPETMGQLRQPRNWQYRSVVVPAGQDPAPALGGVGGSGWEAVGFQVRPAGDVLVLLKHPL